MDGVTISTSLYGATGVYVYDIDGDDNPDVVAAGSTANKVVWYEAPDDPITGSWTEHIIDASMSGARGVFVYDIDGDNNADVVAAGYYAGDILWYEAPDDPITGSWTEHTIDASLAGARGVYVDDIDGDNNPDVVATGYGADVVVWYEAPDDPTQAWTKRTLDVNLNAALSVFIYDIDEDSNPDVVATGYLADDVVWYEAPDDPITGSWMKHTIDGSLDGAYGVYVNDIDADNNPDVVATGYFADDVVWYEAPDDPTQAWTKHVIDGSLDGARGVYVYDIDGEYDLDIVATGNVAYDVVWYGNATCNQVVTDTGTGTAEFCSTSGTIENLTAESVPEGGPDLQFPHGFFSFNVTGLTPGQKVTVTITLPSAVPVSTQYWKHHDPEGWIDMTTLLGDNDGDNILTLTLTDGILGDDDGSANGIIVDQGGPGWPRPLSQGVPASPSLFIGGLAALGAGILACLLRRRLVHQE